MQLPKRNIMNTTGKLQNNPMLLQKRNAMHCKVVAIMLCNANGKTQCNVNAKSQCNAKA
jgi:hypothetical protein